MQCRSCWPQHCPSKPRVIFKNFNHVSFRQRSHMLMWIEKFALQLQQLSSLKDIFQKLDFSNGISLLWTTIFYNIRLKLRQLRESTCDIHSTDAGDPAQPFFMRLVQVSNGWCTQGHGITFRNFIQVH